MTEKERREDLLKPSLFDIFFYSSGAKEVMKETIMEFLKLVENDAVTKEDILKLSVSLKKTLSGKAREDAWKDLREAVKGDLRKENSQRKKPKCEITEGLRRLRKIRYD